MKKSIVTTVAVCAFFAFLFVSCGTSRILLNVKRPAEINLKGFKKIAIGEIGGGQGSHATDVSDGVTTRLVQSNSFDVLDRQNLQKILDEHKLTMTGIVNPDSATELGKIIGTAALVFGRIQADDYKEKVTRNDPWTDKNGGYHQSIFRNGQYLLTVHFQVVDIQSSKILGTKDISMTTRAQTSADNRMPEPISVDNLYSSALASVCDNFMKLVAPYEVTVAADFETDKELPEVENAIAQFKIGESGEAVKILDAASKKTFSDTKIKAKSLYDLGLAQMYSGMYDDAVANIKSAYEANASDRYMNALQQAKTEKVNAEKLAQQGAGDSTAASNAAEPASNQSQEVPGTTKHLRRVGGGE